VSFEQQTIQISEAFEEVRSSGKEEKINGWM